MKFILLFGILFLTLWPRLPARETAGPEIAITVTPWNQLSEPIKRSEIVVVGMVDSYDINDFSNPRDKKASASAKLNHMLRRVRSLGTYNIQDGNKPESSPGRITIHVVQTGQGNEEPAGDAHQEMAKAFYKMLDAPPYAKSNPVIFLVHRGKLVRTYGFRYHNPGPEGVMMANLVEALLAPEDPAETLMPEIIMMHALDLREEKGNGAAIEFLQQQFGRLLAIRGSYMAKSYFWTEAQVRSGAEDPVWASMIYDMMFTTYLREGHFSSAMGIVSNLSGVLSSSGRFGRLAEVMAIWEEGQRTGGNRMDISSYKDLGAAIPCLPSIRHRDMPITKPSPEPIPPGSNALGFHVNDAGAFDKYASHLYSAGRWEEALEYIVWTRDWATSDKTKKPIGEFATKWYGSTDSIIGVLNTMCFYEEALAMVEEGLAAPHGQTYHGRWKIFLAAEKLNSLRLLNRLPSDYAKQFEALVAKAIPNGHITKSGVWGIQLQYAKAHLKAGKTGEGEALLDELVSAGSMSARRARLDHWIESGRIDGVEAELKDLLRYSRKNSRKMSEYYLYKNYADFLENTGRYREALVIRREILRLAKAFNLFIHLPREQSNLAALLAHLGNLREATELAANCRRQVESGRLPSAIVSAIEANLEIIGSMAQPVEKETDELQPVDLQPQRSIVIPVTDLPWTSYLTLTNPSKEIRAGHLVVSGRSAEFSENETTEDITISLTASEKNPAPRKLDLSLQPGSYRLIHLKAPGEIERSGEIEISWKDSKASSSASIILEPGEADVNGAIIQAGEYRANPFYGVPLFLQYVGNEKNTESPPLRFVCSHPCRVEVYQMDQTPLAIDAQGNGSLLDRGDDLFARSDGKGNLILPLTNGSATLNILLYSEKEIPDEGITIDIEAFGDGSWQLFSRNRLTK